MLTLAHIGQLGRVTSVEYTTAQRQYNSESNSILFDRMMEIDHVVLIDEIMKNVQV